MKKVFLIAACCFLTTSLAFSQTQPGQTQQIRAKAKLIHGAPATCPNDPVLVSDGTEASDDLIIPASMAFYALNAKAGHSYSIEVYDHIDSTAAFAPTIKVTSDCTTSIAGVVDVTNVDPDLTGGFSDRVSWIQGSSDQTVYISVSNPDQNNAYTYNIRVTDTTQVNPRWSTYGTFDTQWGLTNTTLSSITGTLTIYKFDGSVVKAINETIQAGQFTNVSARGSGVPVGIYGNAVFTYVGPAGAILPDAVLINSANTVIVPYKFEGKHAYH
jgi:hypothetical protein